VSLVNYLDVIILFHWSSACLSFAIVACLSLGAVATDMMVRQSATGHLFLSAHHHFYYRSHHLREVHFITVFSKFPRCCRCLCWDHVWSWVFANITLSSWTGPTREQPWRLSISRLVAIGWLVEMFSTGNDPNDQLQYCIQGHIDFISFIVVFLWIFVVIFIQYVGVILRM
jgi:hypothetical protein